ncbi:MAG: OpgC domain-containing protein [Chloroflexota bacterium]
MRVGDHRKLLKRMKVPISLARVFTWRYELPPDGRDERLDLLRGFAIFAMVVDHFGGESWLTPFTGRDQFLVSAAEGFVFLSGFIMGVVYGGRIDRHGWVPTAEAILRRAVLLYLVTVGLTLLFVSLFAFTDLRLWFDRAYGLGLTDPVELIVGTLTLHYTYHGTDILWMYTILIAASPLIFHLLITGRTMQLLYGAVALWIAYQLFPNQAAIPWIAGNAVNFPVAAWQLYFVIGLACGHHRGAIRQRLQVIPIWPAFALATLAFIALIILDWGHETGRIATWPLLQALNAEIYHQVFDKSSVAWGRLPAFAIAACFYFLAVSLFWRPIVHIFGWLLVPLGQHALLAYCVHLLAIVAMYNADVWGLYDRSPVSNTLLQSITVALVWGVVKSWATLESLPSRLQALLDAPFGSARQRAGLVITSGIFALVALMTTSVIGPVRVERPAGPTGEDAGTLILVPPATSRILLVLRPSTSTGPTAARDLLSDAQDAGWLVLAPTPDYGEWTSPDDVRGAARRLFPSLRALVLEQGGAGGLPPEPRVYIYGIGRGGQFATMFALAYPELVRAVATVGAVPCTLPVETTQSGDPRVPLLFPEGVGDLMAYRGRSANFDALRRISFWIQLQGPPVGPAPQGCSWLNGESNAAERLDAFTSSLQDLDVPFQVIAGGNEAGPPFRRALRFFEDLPDD